MTTIGKYAKIAVNIIKVTKLRGTESTVSVPARVYVTSDRIVIRRVGGNVTEEKTVLLFKPDANITQQDKVEFEGVITPVMKIRRPRFVGRSSPNHLEVILD